MNGVDDSVFSGVKGSLYEQRIEDEHENERAKVVDDVVHAIPNRPNVVVL